ncbi:MAG: hypothetical protein VX675_06015 [Planctomycetota bacterium]|nr:hypothetical protein [Planctomycetota bacterium]MEC8895859.1 hypothetical protein [Planctomycetota bacterium]
MNLKKWSWKEMAPVEIPAQKLGLEFEASLFEASIKGVDWEGTGAAAPSAGEIGCLVSLHDIYSRLKQKHKGLHVDQLLVKLCPEDKKLRYNLACSHSLVGEIEQAFEELKSAIKLGYDNFDLLLVDDDLDNLRKDPRYRDLLEEFESTL